MNEPATESAASRAWAGTGLALAILALWMLVHPFHGVVHDSQIYTLFSLARLYPGSLGHDFFVRYGTQDHYTVFGPLYAGLIGWLGIDRAAAAITFVAQAGFYGAAWLLARRLAPAGTALLAVGLLAVLPAWYGANLVFAHTELFPTPRQPAEALVLAGMAFLIRGRRPATLACMLAAALLHPIIAGAGLACWIAYELAGPRPRLLAALAAACLVLLGLLSLLPGLLPHFDAAWLSILTSRLVYLFPSRWTAADWAHSVPGVATLVVGLRYGRQEHLRRVSGAVLVTVAAGLTLSIAGGDLLHLVLAAESQAWRWLWLAGVLAALLLVPVLVDCWRRDDLGRATALLLVAAWLPLDIEITFVAAGFACLGALGAGRVDARQQRRLLLAAAAALAAAVIVYAVQVGYMFQRIHALPPAGSHLATRISQARILAGDGALSAGVLVLIWLAGERGTRKTALLLAVLGAAAVLALLPYTLSVWTQPEYTAADAAAFAPWRAVIPQDAEVLWPDNPPDRVWYSLRRASYWSLLQMAGMVFSRQDAMIGTRRESAVAHLANGLREPADAATRARQELQPAAAVIGGLCAVPDLHYFVSARDLGPTPFPPVTLRRDDRRRTLYLYRCESRPAPQPRAPQPARTAA